MSCESGLVLDPVSPEETPEVLELRVEVALELRDTFIINGEQLENGDKIREQFVVNGAKLIYELMELNSRPQLV